MQRTYALQPGEAVLQKTTLTFDDSAVELFWPLMVGGRVVLLAPGLHRDPTEITRAAITHRVAVLQFVPSMLSLWLDTCDETTASRLDALRIVVSSGEALGGHLVRRFRDRLGCGLHNHWGLTEVSIDSTAHACGEDDATGGVLPIGRPITGHRVYLLDYLLRPVPPGASGDIYLGGEGLARGYLGDPRSTAAAFLPDPFHAGRMYRTGDRAYRREDGALVFLGRRDNQVKVRGIRVEVEEIETSLGEDPGVSEVAVRLQSPGPADDRLVAFVVGTATEDFTALRERLASRLPVHMVPSVLVACEVLPRLANDKIDRRALDAIEVAPVVPDTRSTRPLTAAEQTLAAVWAEVLGLDSVGVNEDFFALGGHSLLAPRVVNRARVAFDADIPLSLLFTHPTVARLAAAIEDLVRRQIEALSEEEINEHLTR
jgi:acyl-coenzyme A synthetase/AMP-(fatty) acid ligase